MPNFLISIAYAATLEEAQKLDCYSHQLMSFVVLATSLIEAKEKVRGYVFPEINFIFIPGHCWEEEDICEVEFQGWREDEEE